LPKRGSRRSTSGEGLDADFYVTNFSRNEANEEFIAYSVTADVSPEEFEARLDVCALCPSRSNQHCSRCGCPIVKKARWRSSYCDLGYWPLLEAKP